MQITSTEISNKKYVQIYITKEEFESKSTEEVINKYKQEKCNIAIFTRGKENYPEILKKIVMNKVEENKNVC